MVSNGAGPDNANTADRLLTVAAHLFREKGYAATTTRELAAALGVKSASLYYHMRSKEDLLYDICVDSIQRIDAEVRAKVAEATDPLDELRAFVTTHLRVVLMDHDRHATMLLELRFLPEDRRREVLELRKSYVRVARQILQNLQEKELIRRDLTTTNLSLAIFNTLNWTILWYHPDGASSLDDVIEFLLSFIMAGVQTPGTPMPDGAAMTARPRRRK
ncbi:TetR/AcrR family transcriptional regulator [Actinophytocola sp.]|uniref:TetR/AcrR family transcriptional regulator n=1 Tax=Actinophytocola sp. TaxID=1872138 RepID=UPI003D6BA36C